MGETSIEWTDRTLNPGIYGCELVSPACTHCYAMGMSHRHASQGLVPEGITHVPTPGRGPVWTGKVVVDYARIDKAFAALPKRPRKDGQPIRVFVTSMADLFHKDVPDEFIDKVFVEMKRRWWMIFQALTKRIERVPRWWEGRHVRQAMRQKSGTSLETWPANVWIGTTVEDQKRADERIPHLLRVPAPVRFLSVEPMVGPVDLRRTEIVASDAIDPEWRDGRRGEPIVRVLGTDDDPGGIHWVICGGESGQKARPMHPDWARGVRDACVAAGVPFFFKQWGKWGPVGFSETALLDRSGLGALVKNDRGWGAIDREAHRRPDSPHDFAFVTRLGTDFGDHRLLDGAEWSQFPAVTRG